jgi:methionyl-tRNA formyltransferase
MVFVIGWTQILRPETLKLATIGMIGAHASLLPHNRGRAPINWALIRGEKQTGNSLIWLAEDVDSGDIIDQTVIPISPYDTCASLYTRVGESNKEMIRV